MKHQKVCAYKREKEREKKREREREKKEKERERDCSRGLSDGRERGQKKRGVRGEKKCRVGVIWTLKGGRKEE